MDEVETDCCVVVWDWEESTWKVGGRSYLVKRGLP
jgi:hypothetical protein